MANGWLGHLCPTQASQQLLQEVSYNSRGHSTYGTHTCLFFAQVTQVSDSIPTAPLVGASRSLCKKYVLMSLISSSVLLLSKSLLTNYLSMFLVSTSFCRYLQELFRDQKAMPHRKASPAFFLQQVASLSPLIAVALDTFVSVSAKLAKTLVFQLQSRNWKRSSFNQLPNASQEQGEGWLLSEARLHPKLQLSNSHLLDPTLVQSAAKKRP